MLPGLSKFTAILGGALLLAGVVPQVADAGGSGQYLSIKDVDYNIASLSI
jgi:hypothetical protein